MNNFGTKNYEQQLSTKDLNKGCEQFVWITVVTTIMDDRCERKFCTQVGNRIWEQKFWTKNHEQSCGQQLRKTVISNSCEQ